MIKNVLVKLCFLIAPFSMAVSAQTIIQTSAQLGMKCDGVTDDTQRFLNGIGIGQGSQNLYIIFVNGTCNIKSINPITVPSYITLDFTQAGALSLASGSTMNVNAAIVDLDNHVVFAGSGTYSITPRNSTTCSSIAGGIGCQTTGSVSSALAPSAAYTIFPATSSACTTYSATGTTYCAQNNATGAIDFNGSDAGPVIQSAITARASVGGRFFFKNGVYNINSLTQESTGGFTLFFAIGIPGTCGATNQYCKWILEGESIAGFVGEVASMPVQTGGVILNITSTAVTSAGTATNEIVGIWSRPDTNSLGATGLLSHLFIRFPTNQRGCEAASDPSQALDWEYDNVIADFNIAYTSLAVPVPGSGCSGGEPSGLFGLVTTTSSKNDNWIKNSHAIGHDTGIDIRSEHTYMVHSGSQFCNVAIAYGVNGSNIFHPSVFSDSGWGECLRGLTIGTNTVLGATLNIYGLDIEDATASKFPSFQPVYHAIEQNAGSTNGQVSYATIQAGVGGFVLSNLFDGGGGALFTQSTTNFWPLAKATTIVDSFIRPNNVSLGLPWIAGTWSGTTGAFQISSNTAVVAPGLSGLSSAVFNGQTFTSDQFSKVTINSVTSSGNPAVLTNASTVASTRTYYEYLCGSTAGTGSGIFLENAGVLTTLSAQTSVACANNGDTIELRHIGTQLYALHNGILDTAFLNPISDATLSGGQPGILGSEGSTGQVSFTSWFGGSIVSPNSSNPTFNGRLIASTYSTTSNCLANGTAANPSVVSCTGASAGIVSCATNASGGTCTVNTTAVGTKSEIVVQQRADTNAGTDLGVTCNTTKDSNSTAPQITAVSGGTSFTFQLGTITTNPECFNYHIIN